MFIEENTHASGLSGMAFQMSMFWALMTAVSCILNSFVIFLNERFMQFSVEIRNVVK
jgi:hypothetical protein